MTDDKFSNVPTREGPAMTFCAVHGCGAFHAKNIIGPIALCEKHALEVAGAIALGKWRIHP